MGFKVHTQESAPNKSKEILRSTEEAYGFTPNLHGMLAESPAALQAYKALGDAFADSGLTPTEQNVVSLAVSVENKCGYCVAAHSAAAKMFDMDDETVKAIRTDEKIDDPKLEALRRFATKLTAQNGWVEDHEVQAFLDAGFERSHVLDVVTGIAMKTLSNYTNHIVETPVDDQFADHEWEAPMPVHA